MISTEKSILQKLSVVVAGAVGLFSAVEQFLIFGSIGDKTEQFLYFIIGIASAFFIICFALQGHLLKKADNWIFASLFGYTFLVSWLYYGFSEALFSVRFYFIWMVFVFLFFAGRVIDKPDAFLRSFSSVYVIATCILGAMVLVRATLTLRSAVPDDNRLYGCFCIGRLCGYGNANQMAFYCLVCLLLSVYRCLKGNRIQRILFGSSAVLMWFLMGLNDCRTAIYAFALTLAVFLFALVRKQLTKQNRNEAVKFLLSAAVAAAAAGAVILAFMAPSLIYRALVTLSAKAFHQPQIIDNLARFYKRSLTDMDTLTDRTLIWKRSIELIFKNPRRTLFGVSVISTEGVNGVYEGRHDIPILFAHNMFIEVFRRLGIIGLFIWLTLLFIWGKRAVLKLFDIRQQIDVVYLMSVAAGLLLMGITELGPFQFSVIAPVSCLFFICCGRAMRDDNEKKNFD